MSDLDRAPRERSHAWIRNNIVGLVALFVALSGTTYAAQQVNAPSKAQKAAKKKAKRGPAGPQGPAGPAGPTGPAGTSSTNVLTLGGVPAANYVQRCSAGSVWGFANVNTAAVTAGYSTAGITGAVNCTGGTVEVKRNATGDYNVRFAGSVSGFVVATCGVGVCDTISSGFVSPGEFQILVGDANATLVDNGVFTVVAV
jgi:hypothetical protein